MPEKVSLCSHVLSADCILSEKLIQFQNCRVLRYHKLIEEDLWVENGKIIYPEPLFFDRKQCADIQVDCKGTIVSPGFIDIQINGAFGADFSSCDLTANDVQRVSNGLLQYGVTSYCPTVISSQPKIYHHVLPLLKPTSGSSVGAQIIGAHLEGPFISREKHGVHPIKNVHNTFKGINGTDLLLETYGSSLKDAAIVTIAPEIPNALEAVKRLVEEFNIKVSLGHSATQLIPAENAIKVGACAITHLFNAMEPYHHRDPGLFGLLTSKYIPTGTTVFYGIIADGIHTHDSALRIAHRTDPDGLVVITDAIAALGLGDGEHNLGDNIVQVIGHKAVLKGTQNALAGSVSSVDYCVRHLLKAARCSVVEAIECATLHPAQMLDIVDRKGTLNYGTDADFVFLDQSLNVQATFIAGQLVWHRNL